MYKWPQTVFVFFLSDIFHWVSYPSDPSMMSLMIGFSSFFVAELYFTVDIYICIYRDRYTDTVHIFLSFLSGTPVVPRMSLSVVSYMFSKFTLFLLIIFSFCSSLWVSPWISISLGSVTESLTVFLWWCHIFLFLCDLCSLASVCLKKLSSLLDFLSWLLKRNTFSCSWGRTGACCDLGSSAVGFHVQWCVGAPGLGRLNCCWVRTPMFTTSKIPSSFWWVCESLKRLQRVCEPSAASKPSVYGLGLVVMLVVRVVVCTCSDVRTSWTCLANTNRY